MKKYFCLVVALLFILSLSLLFTSIGSASKVTQGPVRRPLARIDSNRREAKPRKAMKKAGKGVALRSEAGTVVDEAVEDEGEEDNPDRPSFAKGIISEEDYLRARSEYVNERLGMKAGVTYDPMIRVRAVNEMERQEAKLREDSKKGRVHPAINGTTWTNLGPYPIPNGQTNSVSNAVSGRTISIAVHPTNPDLVYVGTAQGGLYRTTNGGTTWTQLFDSAQSQVIGSIAIAPSDPEIVYVGTGENGQCGSGCYAGVGVYRIDNASTTADLTGPINPQITTGVATTVTYNAFTGRSISEVVVAPNDASVIFVATASAIVGNPNQSAQGGTVPPLGLRGLFRINNATGPIGGMTVTKLVVTDQPGGFDNPSTGNRSIMDIALDPADNTGNTMVAFVNGAAAANDGGVWRTTTALTTGTFTKVHTPVTNNIRGEFGVARVAGVTTMYLAAGETGIAGCTATGQGSVRKSTDGGLTWSARLTGGNGFCGGQCFYDIAIAVDPTNPNNVLLGGNVPGTCTRNNGKSTDGGDSFPESSTGLHADSHTVVYAPSDANRVYQGNDGGIFRSNDGGSTWTSLNNSTFSATQFQSVAVHPTDRWFTIGGTQDNGTQFLQPGADLLPFAGWTHSDVGDGGYARIDQTAADTDNVVMYHTYFNQTNAQGIARTTTRANAISKTWSLFGCGFGGAIANGFNCAATTAILFYAPFELGPIGVVGATGQPVYWGADALYRSINQAGTFVLASQQPIVSGVAISSIAISPQDDNYRLVGLNNGTVWVTTTGGSPLTNVTPTGMTGTRTIGRVLIDPNNKNTAYVAYGGQFALSGTPTINHIFKTTNLNAAPPTWTAVGNGLSDVPVNALVVDPANSNHVYAGTDIGVFFSQNSGVNWVPFGTGLPRMAVFDMTIQQANRILRIATHGRGIWEITPLGPTASPATISGVIQTADGTPVPGVSIRLTGSVNRLTVTDSSGRYRFEGVDTDSFYTVRPALANYTFSPAERSFSLLGNKTDAVFTASANAIVNANAIDYNDFFIRQQYVDFLGREPDQGGFDYWTGQLNQCGTDSVCMRARRIDISAAFFGEAEFQRTGSFVYRMYKGVLGRQLSFAEFQADRGQVVEGPNLATTKLAFANAFVERPEFMAKYENNTAAGFVDAVLQTATLSGGVSLAGIRTDLIAKYNSGSTLDQSRALVIRDLADNPAFAQAVYNRSFVLMEYFGYLRRDPDQGGYDFWLDVLNNREPNNYRAMVCAFLTSAEYQRRFSTLVTRTNAECGP